MSFSQEFRSPKRETVWESDKPRDVWLLGKEPLDRHYPRVEALFPSGRIVCGQLRIETEYLKHSAGTGMEVLYFEFEFEGSRARVTVAPRDSFISFLIHPMPPNPTGW